MAAGVRVPPPMDLNASVGQSLWSWHVMERFVEAVSRLPRAEARERVIDVLRRLSAGKPKAWSTILNRKRTPGDPWDLAVESTSVGDCAYIVWWVELVELDDGNWKQLLVIYTLVKPAKLDDARVDAARFLRTFSDDYLLASMVRKHDASGAVIPHMAPFGPCIHRGHIEEVPSGVGLRPISLEKRHMMTERHLQLLKEYSLNGIQMPYVLDADERTALEKVLWEPLFLLGRSGSGKTSVQVHALYYIHEAEREWDCARPVEVAEGDAEEIPGGVLLVTRSPMLAASIRKLYRQMCACHDACETDTSFVELGVAVGELEAQGPDAIPASFSKDVVKPGTSPFIGSWASFLVAADASFPLPTFFRRGLRGETHVERARHRARAAASAGVVLEAGDRFECLGDRYDFEDELSYEYFENVVGPKLQLGGVSLFVVFKEILTVIAGSIAAMRSRAGYLSKEEYVTGRNEDGMPLLVDSSVDGATRECVYQAYETYKKLKAQARKYDRTDPVRHIIQRAKRFNRTKRAKAFRMLSAVFIDEVQDLLPAEILILRLFCQHNNCWIFAGDTAQTISKGVEFRFESIRRLFFDEFLSGRDWAEEVTAQKAPPSCTICDVEIRKKGGIALECHSHFSAHNANVCGVACYNRFAGRCEASIKKATAGARRRFEWAQAHGKLSCPTCKLFMKEVAIPAVEDSDCDSEGADEEVARPPIYGGVPDVHHLTHNHRSTRGILDLAGSIVDILVHLFPDKIDRLPREVSQVDANSVPVFLHDMPFDEALNIVFRQGGGAGDGRHLEFGARQAVLVWSAKSKEHVRKRFPTSIVLTIDECKGLEFLDVLIVSPFSDMASSGTCDVSSAKLWNLLYRYMLDLNLSDDHGLLKRAPAFDPAAHGLLCGWLKALYVAITRARQRVWIFDEDKDDAAKPMLSLWRSARVVRPVASADDASAFPDLAGGLVEVSSAEECIDQGKVMLQSGQYEQAQLLFARAQRAGHPGAVYWHQFAQATQTKCWASQNDDDTKRQCFKEAGVAFKDLARDIDKADLAFRPERLQSGMLRLLAAECFASGFFFQKAARLYEGESHFTNAAMCWEEANKWEEAGNAWLRTDEHEKAMRAYVNGEFWPPFVQVAERARETRQVDDQVLQQLVRRVGRELGDSLKDVNPQEARDKEEWSLLLRCLRLLPGMSREAFLEGIGVPAMKVALLEERGQFADCAVISLEYLKWDEVERFHKLDRREDLARRAVLMKSLRSLGLAWSPTKVEEALAAVRSCSHADGFPSQSERRILEDGFEHLRGLNRKDRPAVPAAVSILWTAWQRTSGKVEANPGHSLRFQLIAFDVLVQAPASTRTATFKSLRDMFRALKTNVKELSKSLASSLSSSQEVRQLPQEVQDFVFELLLVERPAQIRPDCFVLADVLPSDAHGCRLSLDKVLRYAQAVVSLLELRLHVGMLEACRRLVLRLKPCWSHAAHGECHERGCDRSHQADAEPLQREVLERTIGVWSEVRRLSESIAVASAYKLIGPKAHELLDEARVNSSMQKHIQARGHEILNEFLLPAIPTTGLLPFNIASKLEATSLIIKYEIDRLLARANASTNQPTLQELLAPPGALLLCPLVDYHGVPSLRGVMSKRSKDSRDDREARLLLSTFEIAQAASDVGRRAGSKKPVYDDLLEFFRMSCNVVTRLGKDWGSFDWSTEKPHRFFPVAPIAVCHLLERVVVWGNVLLTQFSNTTLPESYVRSHLAGHGGLAALAAATKLPTWPKNERGMVFGALQMVVQEAGRLLKDNEKFAHWVRGHCACYPGTVLRIVTVIFTSGTINWVRHLRNKSIYNTLAVRKFCEFIPRLALMNGGEEGFGPASLPKTLQLLLAGVPKGQRKTTASGDREFDQMTPWFHSVLADLKNPFVLLHREDSVDARAGWTEAKRPLNFHREEFFPHDGPPKKFAGKLIECLGSDWPPLRVTITWPALQRVIVYSPADRDKCNFGEFEGEATAAAAASTVPDLGAQDFVLDKNVHGAETKREGEFTCDANEDAAAALAIAQSTVQLRVVVALRIRLRAARRRLAEQLLDPRSAFFRIAKTRLVAERCDSGQRVGYTLYILPVLYRCEEERDRLYVDLRNTLAERRRDLRGGGQSEDADAVERASDALDELQQLALSFGTKYKDLVVPDVTTAAESASEYWEARRALWNELLLPALRSLGLELSLVSSACRARLKTAMKRLGGAKVRRRWTPGRKRH